MPIFLTNAQSITDLDQERNYWELTEKGRSQADNLHIKLGPFGETIERIISSPQIKALQTVEPLAKILNLGIEIINGLEEIKVGDVFNNVFDFNGYKRKTFLNLDFKEDAGESANEALYRFKQAPQSAGILSSVYDRSSTVLIVSHKTVLTLYFSQLKGILDRGNEVYEKWRMLGNLDFGVILGNSIIKDIF